MRRNILPLLACTLFSCLSAQEGLRELKSNLNILYPDLRPQTIKPTGSEAQRTSSTSLQIPFLDDFYYANKSAYPLMLKWQDSSVYVNTGYPIAPPSFGVATFDGLNKFGYPYEPDYVNMSESRPADTLESRNINLYQSGAQILQSSDSVALSFYYQARGNGEPPEAGDSLLLDFFKPAQNIWKCNVWFSKGNSNPNTNDTAFKRAFLWLSDTAYLHDNFRFRFRNKATTSGNFDHWNLDYVLINKNRSMKGDTVFNDLTFAHVPSSFLKNYASMPYQQYNTLEMASKNSVRIKNNGSQAIAMSYENRIYDKTNALVHSYNGGADNLGPFKPTGYSTYPAHANPPCNYTFAPQMSDSADFTIKHFLYRAQGSSSDYILENDTILQHQVFRNYYAYDDGCAEGGYYVNAVSGKMALRYTLNYDDTLRAFRIYFDPAGALTSAQQINKFRLYVWSSNNGNPGNVIYRDSVMYPKYADSAFKAVPEFRLSGKQLMAAGTYFFGIQQEVASGIVIGFDKNYDYHQNLFYNLGSGWTQSQIKGSLMLRPVFGKFIPSPASLYEFHHNLPPAVNVFPNPSTDFFLASFSESADRRLVLVNSLGISVYEGRCSEKEARIQTLDLDQGLYVLRVFESGKETCRSKVIIHH
ncbi:MAG TPA: T9SS type A sorting domain-containing protein [Bacteroidia bacterium]|nr:T9SS type A sorting domain-containing protein [Bacteroidia bacterium]